MRRPPILIASALLALLGAPGASADGGDAPPEVFFREPDRDTAARIGELISQMATGSVLDRTKSRRALESIGYWSVNPLADALADMEPPRQTAAVLVLDAIADARAVPALRAAVARETSHRYIAAFAALSLGRFRDAASLDALRAASRTTKSMDMLKAAVPFAAAKIRTDEAREIVLERARQPGAREPVRSAALLALGFFPDAAIVSGHKPGPELAAGLASKRRGEREAAVLAFVMASAAHGDVSAFLRNLLAAEPAPDVADAILLGLSRSPHADVTELLAETATRQGDDDVREFAADLLLDRVDAATKARVMKLAQGASSARLRAACVLALGPLEDEDAARLVTDRLTDNAPLVRAAAAVALTRRKAPGAREAGLAAIEPRLRQGEGNDDVRENLENARAILSGERTEVRWKDLGGSTLFSDMSLGYERRLLRAVNLRAMACLDLAKIHNLQTDVEIATTGPPSSGGGDGPRGGGADGGAGEGGEGEGPGDGGAPGSGGLPLPGGGGSEGASAVARTSQYQELRDLKVELLRRPYFGASDLPAPPTTPRAGK